MQPTETHDPNVYSTTYVGNMDVPLTWRELAERGKAEIERLTAFATILFDLSRNENGRHEGDVDGYGPSLGNPHIKVGQVFGYSIHGHHEYVRPPREQQHDPEAWRRRSEEG
jgi:hypothetical protein